MSIVFNISEIQSVAEKMLLENAHKKVWAFYAAMGSGKTTFIHALCDVLKVKDVVSSPTFAIINEYTSPKFKTIYHMDWYRLKNEDEAIQAGVEDAIFNGDLCLIEWPENAPNLLPVDVLKITIELVDVTIRKITIH
ncbi:MAG: tRNA (adenosine(37)-N6)-threonylcarbamoyltransferase complex ATPase subunit type 1 TsaE [Pedobacter sp.]|nr:tRNA (adenosine(37)-N6)-threonylcarbamoyltransferase complex ATPase subunit type 1 TsaE [Chitinophagaceae bacterium]